MSPLRAVSVSCAVALAASASMGCASEEEPEPVAPVPTVPLSGCQVETRADAIAPGLTKTGEDGLNVELVELVPSMPARGDNRWTLELTMGGAPVEDATITPVPWMPDHGHGTTVEAEIVPLGGGQYEIDPLNLWMPGLWEITFDVGGEASDQVVFSLCIEG